MKLVHLVAGDAGPAPRAVGRTATPAGWWTESAGLAALEPLVDALATLCGELAVPRCPVACAVGAPRLVLEPVQVNPALERTVEEQARDTLAGRLDPAGAAVAQALDGEVGVVAAIDRERLHELCLALESAGLEPLLIDAAPLAWIEGLRPDGRALIADFGAGGTTWIWCADGRFERCRTVAAGGQALLAEVATGQGIDRAAAADLVRRGVEPPETWLRAALEPVGDVAALDTILLAGGGALMPGLAAAVEARLERPVATGNPFALLAPAATERLAPEVWAAGPSYGAALGLALALAES